MKPRRYRQPIPAPAPENVACSVERSALRVMLLAHRDFWNDTTIEPIEHRPLAARHNVAGIQDDQTLNHVQETGPMGNQHE